MKRIGSVPHFPLLGVDKRSQPGLPWLGEHKANMSALSALPLGWRHSLPLSEIAHNPAWRLPRAVRLDLLSTPVRDFPRGRISEIVGARSTGRTSVLHALLAASTGRGEFAALADTHNCFDPCSAASAGVELSKLLWIRCGGNAEHALRSTDLLIQAGGARPAGESAHGKYQ